MAPIPHVGRPPRWQGAATFSGGMLNLPGGGTFVNYASVDLGNTISNNPTLSVECWYPQNHAQNWSKVWMFDY